MKSVFVLAWKHGAKEPVLLKQGATPTETVQEFRPLANSLTHPEYERVELFITSPAKTRKFTKPVPTKKA